MKRLSIGLPAFTLVLALALSGTAFTSAPAKTDKKSNPANNGNTSAKPRYSSLHVPFVKEKFTYVYYWFWYSDDSYNDYETMTMEIWELEEFYYIGAEIDSNPMGGTLIMEGYMQQNQPHINYPQGYLYLH